SLKLFFDRVMFPGRLPLPPRAEYRARRAREAGRQAAHAARRQPPGALAAAQVRLFERDGDFAFGVRADVFDHMYLDGRAVGASQVERARAVFHRVLLVERHSEPSGEVPGGRHAAWFVWSDRDGAHERPRYPELTVGLGGRMDFAVLGDPRQHPGFAGA